MKLELQPAFSLIFQINQAELSLRLFSDYMLAIDTLSNFIWKKIVFNIFQ